VKTRAAMNYHSADLCSKCGRELGEHNGTRCPKPDKATLANEAAARRRAQVARELAQTPREQLAFIPVGGITTRVAPLSKNERERQRGNCAVVSIRIDAETLRKLDEEVQDAIGGVAGVRRHVRGKYDPQLRYVSRSSIILDALDAYLVERARGRRAA